MAWYFIRYGNSHFWESPLHMQVSSGPLLKEFGDKPFLNIASENKIKEVRLMFNYKLYRRWLPDSKNFIVDTVRLSKSEVNWAFITAVDDKGGRLISSGIHAGRQIAHTWRCADRQNWWCFPNIYAGTTIAGFELKVPTFGTDEGSGGSLGFPQSNGPQRGDNLAPILEFSYASPEVYIQDVFVDQRYYHAVKEEIVFDAKPANATTRSRVFTAKVRYHDFKEHNAPSLPLIKEVAITLRRPVTVDKSIFPEITDLNMKSHRVRGDLSYAFTDPETNERITGKLSKGYIDIPAGGRIGGLIVLGGELRVNVSGAVGFPVPKDDFVTLPAGTNWHASFITVPPSMAESWCKLIGADGPTPYKINITQGKLEKLNLTASVAADKQTVLGDVSTPLPKEDLKTLIASTSESRKTPPMPLQHYRLPVAVTGLNTNWPLALWRPDGTYEDIGAFEGTTWARLDITKSGPFFIGNTIQSNNPELRIAIIKWTDAELSLEINNPTNHDISAEVWTNPHVADHMNQRFSISIKKGSSLYKTFKK